ncbi:MAG: hypothetical protein QM791_13120 [Ferruginibacter sp.]
MKKYTNIIKQVFPCIFLLMSFTAFTQKIQAPKNSFIKNGPVYFVQKNKEAVILSFTEIKTGDKYSYYLQLNDTSTGALIKRKEIGIAGGTFKYEQLIGKMGNIVWLLTDSLRGYDVFSLEEAVTETTITANNPMMQDNFSRFPNNYLLDEFVPVMYITAGNGDQYKLYPDLSMKPDNSNSDPAPEIFRYEFAAEYKVNDVYKHEYAVNCVDTATGKLFILGSKTETSHVLGYYGSAVYPERDEMRQLTVIPYTLNGESIDFKKNTPHTGERSYYKAGFLQKKFTAAAWHGINDEHIILYTHSTSNPACCIALIDKNGKEKWSVNTSFATNKMTDYLLSADNIYFWFNVRSPKDNAVQTVLTTIRIADGKISSYYYEP